MTIFAIISTESKPELKAAVEYHFKDCHFEISASQFLVSANKTTAHQLTQQIGAPDGKLGRVLILRVSDYGGWHSKDMWEWIVAQLQPPPKIVPEEPNDV